MPDYSYAAMNDKGQIIRGQKSAENRVHLITLLAEEKLFLVLAAPTGETFSLDEMPAEPQKAEPIPEPDATPQPLALEIAGLAGQYFLRRKSDRILIGSIVVFFMILGYVVSQHTMHAHLPTHDLRRKIYSIQSGMTRADVENLFPHVVSSGPMRTVYRADENTLVEVDFDTTGSTGSYRNNVIHKVRMHIEPPTHQ